MALKDNCQLTRSRTNPTRLSSLKTKAKKDGTKKIYYVNSTMKIEDRGSGDGMV